nr:MAG TPA: hypothetical protein [Caudoviricetes sp.]
MQYFSTIISFRKFFKAVLPPAVRQVGGAGGSELQTGRREQLDNDTNVAVCPGRLSG